MASKPLLPPLLDSSMIARIPKPNRTPTDAMALRARPVSVPHMLRFHAHACICSRPRGRNAFAMLRRRRGPHADQSRKIIDHSSPLPDFVSESLTADSRNRIFSWRQPEATGGNWSNWSATGGNLQFSGKQRSTPPDALDGSPSLLVEPITSSILKELNKTGLGNSRIAKIP